MRKNLSPAKLYAGVLLLGVAIGSIFVGQSGAHVGNQIGHLWTDHLKNKVLSASSPKFLYGIGAEFFAEESFVCQTAPYEPSRPETAHIHTVVIWQGGTGGSTYFTKAVYSTDNGGNWQFAEPDWETADFAPDGRYGSSYNQGLLQLVPGTTYVFAVRANHAGGATGLNPDCKLTVEIGPRVGDSIREPGAAQTGLSKGSNLEP